MDALGIRVPNGIDPITACRAWTLDPDGPTLRSLVQGTPWNPGKRFSAECLSDGEGHARSPRMECSCGVWGLSDPADLASQAAQPMVVTGTVRLWGRVVAATRGWRAEHGIPGALVVMPALETLREAWWRNRHPGLPPRGEIISAAAERYGLPVLAAWPALSEPARAAA